MATTVSAAKAKAELSSLINRVAYGGERIIIERHGKPAAALVPVEELERLQAKQGARWEKLGALAFYGAWEGLMTNEEMDEFTKDIYEQRDRDLPRPVDFPD